MCPHIFFYAPWPKLFPSLRFLFSTLGGGWRSGYRRASKALWLESPNMTTSQSTLLWVGLCIGIPAARERVLAHQCAVTFCFLLWKPLRVAPSSQGAGKEWDDFMTVHVLALCALRLRQRTSPLSQNASPSWRSCWPKYGRSDCFLASPAYSQAPTLPPGAPSQLSDLGAEDSKRNGNRMSHLATFDPKVEDHTLLPNLAWGSGSSGNLIKSIGWAR